MNTTQFISEMQGLLDDPSALKYPISMIVRTGDRHVRGLFRTIVAGNKEFSNFTMGVLKVNAVQVMKSVFEYRLPSWVQSVVGVHYLSSLPPNTPTYSVYLWDLGQAQLGNPIVKYREDPLPHWSWEGHNTLRIWNMTEAKDICVRVAKLPHRMFKGRISTVHATQSKFYLPANPLYGEVDLEEGSYINSDWQVTATASGAALQLGDVRRCIYSTPTAILSGARLHELAFDANWTASLAQDDTVETMLSVPDEHTRLVVLKTAQTCFQLKHSLPGLKAIGGELAEETVKFTNYASGPRDMKGPARFKRRYGHRQFIDRERDGYGYNWF